MSGVGSEEVEFEPAIPMEGKVEIYMQVSKHLLPFAFSGHVPSFFSGYGSCLRSVVGTSWLSS